MNSQQQDETIYNLFSEFIEIQSERYTNKDIIGQYWNTFKKLIMKKPIDYNQVYTLISKLTGQKLEQIEDISQVIPPSKSIQDQPNEREIQEKQQNQYFCILQFSEFLQKYTSMNSSNKLYQNQFYNSCNIIDFNNISHSNLVLKYIAIAHIKYMLIETFGDNKQYSIFQLFNKINQKKLKICPLSSSFYTTDQLHNSLIKNFGNLINMKIRLNKSVKKLIRIFIFLINLDQIFMQACISLIKALMCEYCETSPNEILEQFLPYNEYQDKEYKNIIINDINQNWKEIKPEQFYLLSTSLNRQIEVHTLKNGQVNKMMYTSKIKQKQNSEFNNKINMMNIENQYFLLIFANDTENFLNLLSLQQEDAVILEDINYEYLIQKFPVQNISIQTTENQTINSINVSNNQMTPQQQFIEQPNSGKFQTATAKYYSKNHFLNNSQEKQSFNSSLKGIDQNKQSQEETQKSIPNQLNNHQKSNLTQNKYSHFEQTSSKLQIASTLQKSSINSYKTCNNETIWNKNLLMGKAKELLFNINIDTDKLNNLAKFISSTNNNGLSGSKFNNNISNLNYSLSKENVSYHNQKSQSPSRQIVQNVNLQQRVFQKQGSNIKF